ncbi:MAG: hypothetical protein A3D65_02550 [Candidatus Lloydbacteria bacterium RIFCSPHIGHO2_02_FULL_50_13]|uniref:Restriction endonuclease type II-like domain-containing protein n=1 Tax=Candidatus Lloydbacteria bacterium RIFCSPHIGHO2_02_FULL_50_13 TaxID=1798661 RepID=A0A1G2D3Q1_9BACT|nr:MAG: hypothetical protein A3D65_02550 [Candidatus Lloydbacteria bacterium RIFCSPHIGHO2_02_FULL_50_13]
MKRKQTSSRNATVLVGVLKQKSDLRILLRGRWYRVPAAFFPKRRFAHIAFYQPAVFGIAGKCVRYYAHVRKIEKAKRIALLPKETDHPRAGDDYFKILFREIKKLPHPIKNIIPRRVSFGFTSLKKLLSAKDILELYGVPKTEQIIGSELKRRGIETVVEHTVSAEGRRYRIDIAVFCRNGRIAIECDNEKAHSGKAQKGRDKAKDAVLKRHGWHVIRLIEKHIIGQLDSCARRIEMTVQNFGGQL